MRRGKTLPTTGRGHLAPRLTLLAAVAIGIVILAAGGPARAGTIRHDRDPQTYLNLGSDPAYASVGKFDIAKWEPGFTGSGTLVGGQWVLTAAHLFENATSVDFTVGGQAYGVSGWVNHPKWDGDVRHGNDLALAKLSTPVSGVTPAQIYTGRREQGAVATFVGYGRTGDGVAGAQTFDGLKRAGQNTIDGTLGKGSFTHNATFVNKLPKNAPLFIVDFDNPAAPADNVVGSPLPLDMEYLISLGDSGGGAFADFGDGRGQVLVGVHSFAEIPDGDDDSDYGDVTGHMRVSRSAKWVRQTLRRDALGRRLDLATTGVKPFWFDDSTARQLAPGSVVAGAAAVGVVPEPGAAVLVAGAAGIALLRRPRRQGLRTGA